MTVLEVTDDPANDTVFYKYCTGVTETPSLTAAPPDAQAALTDASLAATVRALVSGDAVSEPDGPEWLICPTHGDTTYWNRTLLARLPRMCSRLRCLACVVGRVFDVGAALAFARPTISFMVMGRFTGQRKHDTKVLKAFDRAARQRIPGWESAMVIEANPEGTGFHAHGWAHADLPIREGDVRAAAEAVGFTYSWAGAPRPHAGREGIERITYGMKACRDRPAGATELWLAAELHLELNGGRLIRLSRGFLRNGYTGEQLPTLRRAITAAKQWGRGVDGSGRA